MSYRPHGFAFFLPTGGSLPGALGLYQAKSPSDFSSSPCDQAVFVPARATYSHSASDGRRMTSSAPSSFSLRSSPVTLSQNDLASFQSSISTELRGPFHLAGLSPMTTNHSSCVTSYLAMSKLCLSATLWAGCSLAAPLSVPIVKS